MVEPLVAWQKINVWAKSPHVRRWMLPIALILFTIGLYLSVAAIDWAGRSYDYVLLTMVAFVVSPAIILLNVLELKSCSKMVGARLPFSQCFRVSILSSAANLLPLPGGPVLRAAAISDSTGTVKSGVLAVLWPALVWMAFGSLFSSFAMLVYGSVLWGGLIGLAGITLLAVSVYLIVFRGLNRVAAIEVSVIKLLGAFLDSVAVYFVFLALGDVVTFGQTLALASSAPLGAAVSIVPAGLGVREIVSAGLGTIVGLTVAQAYLAPSVYRCIYLAVLLPASLFLLKVDKRK